MQHNQESISPEFYSSNYKT